MHSYQDRRHSAEHEFLASVTEIMNAAEALHQLTADIHALTDRTMPEYKRERALTKAANSTHDAVKQAQLTEE